MTEDILKRAKALWWPIPRFDPHRLIMCDLIDEVERLRSEIARINRLREAEIDKAGAAERVYLEAAKVKDARIKKLDAEAQEYHDKKEAVITMYSNQNRYMERQLSWKQKRRYYGIVWM